MKWKSEEYRLARHVVYWSGRVVANLASREGRRLPLAWMEDVLFQGVIDGLEHNDVPRTLMADLLGVSPRSLRRRIASVGEYAQPSGLNIWTSIHEWCVHAPHTREEIFRRFSSVSVEHLTTILNDMVATQWLEHEGDLYSAMVLQQELDDEALDRWLITHDLGQLDSTKMEALSSYMNVPLDRLVDGVERVRVLNKYKVEGVKVIDPAIQECLRLIHTIVSRLIMRQKDHGTRLSVISVAHLDEETRHEFMKQIKALGAQMNLLFARYRQPNHVLSSDEEGEHFYCTVVFGRGKNPKDP